MNLNKYIERQRCFVSNFSTLTGDSEEEQPGGMTK